jgi:hypothetical protein
MKRKWFTVMATLATASLLCSTLSCGYNQHLVSIALQPSEGFVFEGYNAQGQFTALGTYIHPPQTKDVTSQAAWTLNIANFGTLTQTGQITYTRTDGCGSGEVTATVNTDPSDPKSGSVITASAPVKGVNDGTSTCQ